MRKIMRKQIFVLFVLFVSVILGCGGGSTSYIGFTPDDFSNKTIYYVRPSIQTPTGLAIGFTAKLSFRDDGSLVITYPGTTKMELGTWEIINGKLQIIYNQYPVPNKITNIFTLIRDDAEESYFAASQLKTDGSEVMVALFYDQVTGYDKSYMFFFNNRQP